MWTQFRAERWGIVRKRQKGRFPRIKNYYFIFVIVYINIYIFAKCIFKIEHLMYVTYFLKYK